MSVSYRLLVNGEPYEVTLLEISRELAVFSVGDRTYRVSFEHEVAGSQPAPTRETSARTVHRSKTRDSLSPETVRSPIPGVVLQVLVSEGQLVQEGDTVARVEAMKMENNIFAHRSGIVTKVYVATGAEVADGEPLLDIALA